MNPDIASELEAAFEVGLASKTLVVDGHTVALLREGYGAPLRLGRGAG